MSFSLCDFGASSAFVLFYIFLCRALIIVHLPKGTSDEYSPADCPMIPEGQVHDQIYLEVKAATMHVSYVCLSVGFQSRHILFSI